MKSKTKSKSLIAFVLAVVMLASVFAVSATSALAAESTKTASTPWGTLYGYLNAFQYQLGDTVYTFVAMDACLQNSSGAVISSPLMEKTIASYDIVDYYTGALLKSNTKTSYNNLAQLTDTWNNLTKNNVSVFGCCEVRYTTSYAVYPTLYGVG